MTRVAVIGVGRMGARMSRRLMGAGHGVIVCDPVSPAVEALCSEGAERAEDPAGAAEGAEVTITSLPTPKDVESVVLGPRGVLAGASSESLVVDTSTSLPSVARRLAEAGRERGVSVLDAPVSGGPRGAEKGTLAIMVGGEEGAFERALPLLETFGSTIRRMGGPGAGQATKLTNNLLSATHMAVLGEAVALARAEGLDLAKVYEIISNGTGDSRVLRNRYPVPGVVPDAPASRDWEPLFPVDLIAKDVALALETAAENGLTLPVLEVALTRYPRGGSHALSRGAGRGPRRARLFGRRAAVRANVGHLDIPVAGPIDCGRVATRRRRRRNLHRPPAARHRVGAAVAGQGAHHTPGPVARRAGRDPHDRRHRGRDNR